LNSDNGVGLQPVVLINQPFGVGDILFCQSIAQHYVKMGHKVLWPVEPVYVSLQKHFPDIFFIDRNLLTIDLDKQGFRVEAGISIIPIRFSDTVQQVPYKDVMRAKYDMLRMDFRRWKENCVIKRDVEKEKELYYQKLGLQDGERFVLVSENFTTGGKRQRSLPVSTELKIIYMTPVDGFTIIDWLMVIERAEIIHAVSSANIYLFELFELSAKRIHLYIRRPNESSHINYEYLLSKTKPYILEQ
jgi:hypothetical protein